MRRSTNFPKKAFSLDLHVLSTPPAFNLSQDQTLQLINFENSITSQVNMRNRHILFLIFPNSLFNCQRTCYLAAGGRYCLMADLLSTTFLFFLLWKKWTSFAAGGRICLKADILSTVIFTFFSFRNTRLAFQKQEWISMSAPRWSQHLFPWFVLFNSSEDKHRPASCRLSIFFCNLN